jgi:MFS family permease
VRVLDVEGLLGLGPAIVLGSGALVALPAGLLMDRVGRVPVLAGGFAAGAGGCALAALGSAQGWALAVLGGFAAGRELDGDALSTLWLGAGGFMVAGMAIVDATVQTPGRAAVVARSALYPGNIRHDRPAPACRGGDRRRPHGPVGGRGPHRRPPPA